MTGASANGDGLLDLEAASAAAATEADRRPFTFAYKGARYEVPPSWSWSMADLDAVAAGDIKALRQILGAEIYGQLIAAGIRQGELKFLLESMTRESGMTLPNSGPPPQRVSTRTSKR